MTVSSTVRRAGPFLGNGTQTVFPFEFKVLNPDDLLVAMSLGTSELGVDVVELEYNHDYTVQLNQNQEVAPGGSITLNAALAIDHKLAIISDRPYVQEVALTNLGGFFPTVINKGLDNTVIQTQQLAELTERAIKVPVTDGRSADEYWKDSMDFIEDAKESTGENAERAEDAADRAEAAQQDIHENWQEKLDAADAAADTAVTAAGVAVTAADRAEAAATSAALAGDIFPNPAAGIAGTTNGQYFRVIGSNDTSIDIYLNDNGTAVYQVSVPSTASIQRIFELIFESRTPDGLYPYPHSESDKNGNLIQGINQDTGAADLIIGKAAGLPLLDDRFQRVWTNEKQQITHALTYDGSLAFKLDMNTFAHPIGLPLLDDRYVAGSVDKFGNFMEAMRWDGTSTGGGGSADELDIYPKISPAGRQQVKMYTTRELSIGSAFQSYGPAHRNDQIQYIEQATVGVYKRYKLYPFSIFPVSTTNITHFIGFGESLAAGTKGDPTLTTPPLPSRLFMMNAGVLTLGREQDASAKNIVIDDAGLQYCIPALSQIKESPALAAAYRYALDNPSEVVVVTQHGIGGALISWMVRGNEAYDNLVHTASQVKCIADTNNATYKIAPISYIQGTNDWDTPEATYSGMLDTLWNQLNEDLKAVSGQSADIVIVLDQTLAGNPLNDGSLAFTQVEKALAQPSKFRCSNPRFGVPYAAGDNSHLTGPGYVNLGTSQGYAARPGYLPLYPVSAVRSGTTVTVQFSEGNLVLDTTSIGNTPDGNYGFFWKDDSNSAVITNVSLSDSTITITLDQEPIGTNPQIRIADRRDPHYISPENVTGTGKRCCLRTASLGNDPVGNPVYKRAAIFRINVI